MTNEQLEVIRTKLHRISALAYKTRQMLAEKGRPPLSTFEAYQDQGEIIDRADDVLEGLTALLDRDGHLGGVRE